MKKPSVTQLLDLLAKPALIGWANRLGLEGININDKRKESLAKGSALHKQIEEYCKGEGDFEKDIDRLSFQQFMRGKKIIDVEGNIETEWFIGRYDAKISVDGVPYIIDYKRGYNGKLYLENKLQLIAYAMASEEKTKVAVVGIPQFVFVPFEITDRTKYEEILIALSKIYQAKREIAV